MIKLLQNFLKANIEEVKDFIKADGTVDDTDENLGLGYQEINPNDLMRNGLESVKDVFEKQLSTVQRVFGDDMIDFQNVTIQDLEDQIKLEKTMVKLANYVIKFEDCNIVTGHPAGKNNDRIYNIENGKLVLLKTKYNKLIARFAQSVFIRTCTEHHCGSCGRIPRNARVRLIITPKEIFDAMHSWIFSLQIHDGTEKTLEQIQSEYNTLPLGVIANYKNLVPLCENCEQLYKLKNYPLLEISQPDYFKNPNRVACLEKTKLRSFRKNVKRIKEYDSYSQPYHPRGFNVDFSRFDPGHFEIMSFKKIDLREFNDEEGNKKLEEHLRIAQENEEKDKKILEGVN